MFFTLCRTFNLSQWPLFVLIWIQLPPNVIGQQMVLFWLHDILAVKHLIVVFFSIRLFIRRAIWIKIIPDIARQCKCRYSFSIRKFCGFLDGVPTNNLKQFDTWLNRFFFFHFEFWVGYHYQQSIWLCCYCW